MKVKSLIVSLILIVCFAGIGIGLYCAWPAITGTITDSKYYTSEDLQDAYDKGYDDAFKNKDELTQQVDYYKELTDTYYISILDYQAQIKDYEILTENNKNTISLLEQDKTEMEAEINNLTTIKNNNEATIKSLNSQITDLNSNIEELNSEIISLKLSGLNKESEIKNLNNQINSLNEQISNLTTLKNQLQSANNSHINTITLLNQQIVSLNSQITNLTSQIQNNSNIVGSLNNKITELEKSIEYYETFISSLESSDKVIATFEYDGSVYNIQVVTKGSNLSVVSPVNTEYKIFNYWTVNGEQIDLSTYSITESTKFVANITYKFDIKFIVDNEEYDSQIIVKNGFATLPQEPTKAGYEFSGWSLNGIDIIDNISTTPITQNITYIAVFTKLHTVTFMNGDNIYETQYVKNGNFATNVIIENEGNKIFKGWKVNDIAVDVSKYQILSDTIFTADIVVAKTVEFYISFNSSSPEQSVLYDTKYVEENCYVELPIPPEAEDGYAFKGWYYAGELNFSSLVVDLSIYPIIEDMKFVVVFERLTTYNFYIGEELFYSVDLIAGENFPDFENPEILEENTFGRWYYMGMDGFLSVKKELDLSAPAPKDTGLSPDYIFDIYWETYTTIRNINIDVSSDKILYKNEILTKDIVDDVIDFEVKFTVAFNSGDREPVTHTFTLENFTRVDAYDTRNYYYQSGVLLDDVLMFLRIYYDNSGQWEFIISGGAGLNPEITSLTINYLSILN